MPITDGVGGDRTGQAAPAKEQEDSIEAGVHGRARRGRLGRGCLVGCGAL